MRASKTTTTFNNNNFIIIMTRIFTIFTEIDIQIKLKNAW